MMSTKSPLQPQSDNTSAAKVWSEDVLPVCHLSELKHFLARRRPGVVTRRIASLDLGMRVPLSVVLCDPNCALPKMWEGHGVLTIARWKVRRAEGSQGESIAGYSV